MNAGYELFDHPADIGIRARGPDPASAFAEIAFGMFAVVLGEDPRTWQGAGQVEGQGEGEVTAIELAVSGEEWPELLVNWLAELLFRFDVEAFVPQAIAFRRCEPPACEATLEGRRLSNPEDVGGVAVKAITYHQLEANVGKRQTKLQVIVDI